jgi:hypothetical protein
VEKPDAYTRLVTRCAQDSYWSETHHEYILPNGAISLACGNAGAPGIQAAVLLSRYPKLFKAARREREKLSY